MENTHDLIDEKESKRWLQRKIHIQTGTTGR